MFKHLYLFSDALSPDPHRKIIIPYGPVTPGSRLCDYRLFRTSITDDYKHPSPSLLTTVGITAAYHSVLPLSFLRSPAATIVNSSLSRHLRRHRSQGSYNTSSLISIYCALLPCEHRRPISRHHRRLVFMSPSLCRTSIVVDLQSATSNPSSLTQQNYHHHLLSRHLSATTGDQQPSSHPPFASLRSCCSLLRNRRPIRTCD